MPRQSAVDEITALRTEHARLTVIVEENGTILMQMDAARKPISEKFSTAWTRRDNIERRFFLLERKIMVIKPAGERKPAKEKNVEEMMAKLTPAQMAVLRAILEKG